MLLTFLYLMVDKDWRCECAATIKITHKIFFVYIFICFIALIARNITFELEYNR